MSETKTKQKHTMNAVTETTSKSRGVSLRTALVLLLILAAVSAAGLGALAYYWKADKARTQRQFEAFEAARLRAELEQKKVAQETELKQQKAAQEAQLAQARNRQNAVRSQAQHATNLLGQVAGGLRRLLAEAAALRTNTAGQQIAQYADLVGTARRLYESELRLLPSLDEIQSQQENARRVDQQMGDALGTTYEPDPGFAAALQNDVLTSGPELRQVERCQSLLTALIQEARAKTGAATMSPVPATLDAALAQLAQSESVFRQRVIAAATEEAKPQAAQLIADAERERIMQEARWQVTNVINEMRGLLQKQNNENVLREAEFQKAVVAAQWQASNVMQAMAELRQQKVREINRRQDDEHQRDTEELIRQEKARQEARKIELRHKAEDSHVQTLLAPFTTPAYQQYRTKSYEKQPLSYTELASIGALTPTRSGLLKLGELATRDLYRERPRWKLRGGPLAWANFPESVEQVKEAQALLIELGPVLVELNQLAP